MEAARKNRRRRFKDFIKTNALMASKMPSKTMKLIQIIGMLLLSYLLEKEINKTTPNKFVKRNILVRRKIEFYFHFRIGKKVVKIQFPGTISSK